MVCGFNAEIIGMIFVCHQQDSTLFNLGSTISYVSAYFASRLVLCSEFLSVPLCIATPVDDSLVVDRIHRS